MKTLLCFLFALLAVSAFADGTPFVPASITETRAGTSTAKGVTPRGLADWSTNVLPTQPVLSAVDNGTRTTIVSTNPIEMPSSGFIGKLLPNGTNYTVFTNLLTLNLIQDYGTAAFYQPATTNARGSVLIYGIYLAHGFNGASNYLGFLGVTPNNADTNDPVLIFPTAFFGTAGAIVYSVSGLFFDIQRANINDNITNTFTNTFTFSPSRVQFFTNTLTGWGSWFATNGGGMPFRVTIRRLGDDGGDTQTGSNYYNQISFKYPQKIP